MSQKSLGLVIASYRYGHLAAHCIETALSQSVPFDAIYFVDDGANDCSELTKIYRDENINWIFNRFNIGIVGNFNNVLFSSVSTDYVMYVGADNWLASNTCQEIKKAIHGTPMPDIVTYDILVTGILKNEIHQFYANDMTPINGDYYWSRRNKHHGSMAYNVLMAKALGGYANNKTSARTDEDWNLWNKMTSMGAAVHHIPSAFLYYRRHKENFNKY